MKSATLTSGALASAAGVHIETLRFYERSGLIAEPRRSAGGYRQYPPDTVARLRFIKRAQGLGFSLSEIGQLLRLRSTPGRNSVRVKRLSEKKIAVIEAKIRDLQRMHEALAALSAACDGKGATGDCPILKAIDECDT
jgi:Hg(II)-responsive transcriptional regulator